MADKSSYERIGDDVIEQTSFKKPSETTNLIDRILDLNKPIVYKRRWAVLLVFMFVSTINNNTQYTFSPISQITLE